MKQISQPMIKQWSILLALTVLSMLILEHSQLDIRISEFFYANGTWLLEKGAQPYAFIFYDFPKALLIVLGVALLITLISKYRQNQQPTIARGKPVFDFSVLPLSGHETSYLLITLIVVPTVIAALKGITHVSCPNHLYLFNGDLPYLNIWQNILAKTPAKCFPAAHASAGFALYGLAYLPSLQRYRSKIIVIATVLGWTMGLYKMLIGDHFFSHTLVSMLLSWTIACGLAMMVFSKLMVSKRVVNNGKDNNIDNVTR